MYCRKLERTILLVGLGTYISIGIKTMNLKKKENVMQIVENRQIIKYLKSNEYFYLEQAPSCKFIILFLP